MSSDEKSKAYGLRSQLEKYFERQAQNLLDQAHSATFLTSHTGLLGNAGEQSVHSFLRKHLPGRYGVGTGHVVSFQGNSSQSDAIIFDAPDCFKIPITESETLFSIEGVHAAIEIKSSPKRRSESRKVLKQAVANIASINNLTYVPNYWAAISISGLPTFTRISDAYIASRYKYARGVHPICAILMLGTGASFDTLVKQLREESDASKHPYGHGIPDLFCVLDEKNYGLYGFDAEEISGTNQRVKKFWREECKSQGQTLALFLYWLIHKIILEHVAEQPIMYHANQRAVWPSVMTPVIPRVPVDAHELGHSWGPIKETRHFEE